MIGRSKGALEENLVLTKNAVECAQPWDAVAEAEWGQLGEIEAR